MNNESKVEDDMMMHQFLSSWNETAKEVHQNAVKKGFWDAKRNQGEILALIHSEVSEALEELRKPQAEGQKVAEELADVVIRVMDYAVGYQYDVGKALLDKMEKNRWRPPKHGKAF